MALSDRIPARPEILQAVNGSVRRIPPWTLYVAGAGWAAWLFWLGLTGGLGPEPITELEHRYGEVAINLLVAGLAVTPLRRHLGVNLMPFRRAIGVLTFAFLLAHVLVWAALDVQALDRVWKDILERPYITIGMGGFVLLLPLALTSNDWSVRRLGGLSWRRLHRLVYPAAILGALHYVWLAKGFQIEPLVYMGVILGLIALRFRVASRLGRG
jgi:sulfoxide reductase heme-binding subunit YedZ